MLYGESLVHVGIGIMIAAVIAALVVLLIMRVRSKRLKIQLESEYGKKRH